MEKRELPQYKIPDSPGVYIFKKGRKKLYIGKATSLRDRVRSYFSSDIAKTRGLHIEKMVREATAIEFTTTESVLEALICEANEIKLYMPPYNAASKDNKSFNYLILTKEMFPKVLVVRGRILFQQWKASDIRHTFGPFPEGLALQEALKIVRKIFAFRDLRCTPCAEQKIKNGGRCKPCFNRQIGLCPGVCTGEVSEKEYAKTIQYITQLFSGNFMGLKRQLVREMKVAAKKENYELAKRLRRQCAALEHVKDVSLIKHEKISAGGGARIEAFDVAHTSGTDTVAVMTVVHNGEAVRGEYRKFKIRTVSNNDVAALKEAVERRLVHTEWQLPKVFAIDGGIAQVRVVEKVLKKAGIQIPVIGITKDERHKPVKLLGATHILQAFEKDILLANSEAHRFAITWHRKLRGKIY